MEANFVEVMQAVYGLRHELRANLVPREHCAALWDLCSTARYMGVDPQGPLQRNKLISTEDVSRLDSWTRILEDVSLRLLHGKPDEVAFYGYIRSIAERRTRAPADPWGAVAQRIAEFEFYDPEDMAVAIRAIGILRYEPAKGRVEIAARSDNADLRAAGEEAMRELASGPGE